jgi:hypothetical protein
MLLRAKCTDAIRYGQRQGLLLIPSITQAVRTELVEAPAAAYSWFDRLTTNGFGPASQLLIDPAVNISGGSEFSSKMVSWETLSLPCFMPEKI